MEKKRIVIVDTDEEYLAPLEYRILEEWEEKAEIEVITQLKYYNEYFSQPHNIFLLIINEFLYNEKIQKQNCRHVFVLSEVDGEQLYVTEDKKCQYLYKYSSVKEILGAIKKEILMDEEKAPVEQTQLYVVYSPCGGSGKTLSALGISSALADMGKRVLYINTETSQDFDFYLEEKACASPAFCYALATADRDLDKRVSLEIGKEEFEYLRPFEKSPLSYQVTEESYLYLVDVLMQMKKYDVIVMEVSRELTRGKLQLMERANRIMNICLQTEDAAYKITRLMKNMHWRPEQWIFICNRYKKENENCLSNQISLGAYSIAEYINEREFPMTLEDIRNDGIFDTTVYLLD